VLLVVDELADVVAYQTDRGLKARANAALQSITSQGRAPGVCVVGQVQDPRKAVLDFRHLFPTKIAMRLDEPDQVNLALGDGARARGAAADEISEDTPGVGWVLSEGRRQIDRVRAFHLDDAHLDELDGYVGDGSGSAPTGGRSMTSHPRARPSSSGSTQSASSCSAPARCGSWSRSCAGRCASVAAWTRSATSPRRSGSGAPPERPNHATRAPTGGPHERTDTP
jgi:S-DNA-T family DNA segregation ATPase FtsK/SpoIIIE